MPKKLSVQLVTWNGEKYISHLFDSLKNQSFDDWKLNILDNDSEDKTVKLIEQELQDFDTDYEFEKSDENLGFAVGHNQIYQDTESEYILLLNQDMYLESDCLENLVKFMENNKEIAAGAPRLMRWDIDKIQEDDLESSLSNFVDALGLSVFRNRRVIEQYTQRDWNKLKQDFDTDIIDVFGVSGAFPMYRRSALDKVAFDNGNFFDEDYHSYKEDVDLAFRLQSAGYKSKVILDTVAYHDRSAAGPKDTGDMKAIKNKLKQSSWVKYHSYKNHLMTIYKNEYWQNFLLDFPFILWYELKKFIWYLLVDISVLKGLSEIWSLRNKMKNKRKQIKKKRVKDYKEMRKNWKNK